MKSIMKYANFEELELKSFTLLSKIYGSMLETKTFIIQDFFTLSAAATSVEHSSVNSNC